MMSSCEKKAQNLLIGLIQLSPLILKKTNRKQSNIHKKMSSCLLSFKTGSMTVEIALVLPIFLFFMANILSLFLVFEEYSVNYGKMHDKVCNMTMLAHMETNTLGNECVELKEVQPIVSLFNAVGFPKSYTTVYSKARKWTGYDVNNAGNEKNSEEYVYITESGYAYHRSRECSHLKISVSLVSSDSIENCRNSSGAKYYPCEKCARNGNTGIVFITEDGNRYHSSVTCSGLKRKVKTVKISEVGGRRPCSECG